MSRTYSQIASIINTKLQKAAGTLTDADFMASINFALDKFCDEVDPVETLKTVTLSPALFKDVIIYNIPSDLRGEGIIDLRPVVEIPNSSINNNWSRNTGVEFTSNQLGDKQSPRWTIEVDNGVSYLKLFNRNIFGSPDNIALNTCDAYNSNGVWTADAANSDANTVGTNTLNYFEGSGSVSFNVTVAQSGNHVATIYNPSINAVDISGLTSPYLFFYVYLPSTPTYLSSITFRIGSDTAATPSTKTNYYTFTALNQFGGSAFVQGRNLIGIPISSAVSTGSPNQGSLKYLELNLNYTASQTDMSGVLLDAVYMREGVFYQTRYYSTNIVVSASGTKKQYFTADDDTTLLTPEGEASFIEFATGDIAPSIKDFDSAQLYQGRGQRALEVYKAKNPSQRRRFMKNWYGTNN